MHKAILSPIRHLPPEILAEIFAFAVDATFHFGDISEVTGAISHQAPWVFTRVCRRWADIALATPSLWSMVFLDLDRIGQRGAVKIAELLHERSRNLPLTLKIFCEQPWHHSHQVLDTALAHVERWENVDLYMRLPLFLRLAAVRGRLSSLTTLTVSLEIDQDEMDSPADPKFGDIFADAPKLTALCASFWDDDNLRCSPFAFPWHQLTRLSTTFTSDSEALSVLQKLSSIVDCRLEYVKTDSLASYPPIRLPHLRSLLVQLDETTLQTPKRPGKRPMPSLLDSLDTPILESLTTHQTADASAVLGLLARSRCADSLRTLSFQCAHIRPDTILSILHKLPSLASLEVGDLNGALLPRAPSLIPGFVRALAADWRANRGARRSLTARIVDCLYTHDISDQLASLEQAGLFITVSAHTRFQSVIMDRF